MLTHGIFAVCLKWAAIVAVVGYFVGGVATSVDWTRTAMRLGGIIGGAVVFSGPELVEGVNMTRDIVEQREAEENPTPAPTP